MTVYVDDTRLRLGNMIMSHMWSESLDELLAMADRIGVQRKWIQGHPTLSHGKHRNVAWVHFDISLSKKEKALRYGAVLTDRYGPVEYTARLDANSDDPKRRRKGKKMLAAVEQARERRAKEAA
ncbi:DUF4031 domain-containing protein [Novosphingobium pentaromativorans]|uniref:DUF4031 domain-containing protein n=1 Tax=Novosphingobium pentaromativorans US6-1 TaxID=1088721 RepID=G6E7E5_9SPHN|nr:DUF4031 domain-containing protein [Novosphingobium pentaromativorans]AIT81648.1 hypothetical protein JI59_18720 [Novosphingobium pentaromativorans US6-1]EHJ62768.1 hypothetical protein NSU_0280 [Novosphingobium pentaromativorans US6-1]